MPPSAWLVAVVIAVCQPVWFVCGLAVLPGRDARGPARHRRHAGTAMVDQMRDINLTCPSPACCRSQDEIGGVVDSNGCCGLQDEIGDHLEDHIGELQEQQRHGPP